MGLDSYLNVLNTVNRHPHTPRFASYGKDAAEGRGDEE